MGSQTVWLPTALYTALIRLQLDDFTATGCVSAVFGAKAEPKVHRKRYSIIYLNLIKLVRLGLLKRKHVDDGKRFSHFIKTPKFDEVHFKEEFIGPSAHVTESGKEREPETYESVLEGLIARAQHYRKGLQECDSMLAEYQELKADFSILDPAIDRAINNTVAESRDLRGRLEAVERLLRGLIAFRSAS
ncbi:hypothetical protein ACK399_07140 [Aeromonas veronii]|uniref:hypothetical protein n=1 Tax=Aeromonas TaxID=642 RepID=UPI000371BDB0|nr:MULTISPECIES: hypothetical protein [Aeromonas]MCR3953440.1 hypothetical protein [Aeromonas hydrophila]WLD19591.1 hypothetical protein O1Q77_15645 [Aeromonas veronii]